MANPSSKYNFRESTLNQRRLIERVNQLKQKVLEISSGSTQYNQQDLQNTMNELSTIQDCLHVNYENCLRCIRSCHECISHIKQMSQLPKGYPITPEPPSRGSHAISNNSPAVTSWSPSVLAHYDNDRLRAAYYSKDVTVSQVALQISPVLVQEIGLHANTTRMPVTCTDSASQYSPQMHVACRSVATDTDDIDDNLQLCDDEEVANELLNSSPYRTFVENPHDEDIIVLTRANVDHLAAELDIPYIHEAIVSVQSEEWLDDVDSNISDLSQHSVISATSSELF